MELPLMSILHAQRRKSNSLHHTLCSIQSPLFAQDVSSALAILAIAAVSHLGYRLYWQIIAAYTLSRMLMAVYYDPPPVKLDNRLLPALCSFRGSSSASPSISIATVVFIELALTSPSALPSALCIAALLLLCYARLLSMVFFPHQIMNSIAMGVIAIGTVRVMFTESRMQQRLPTLDADSKLAYATVALLLALMEVALRVEDSSAVVLRDACVAKKEYVRVMTELWRVQPASRGSMGVGNVRGKGFMGDADGGGVVEGADEGRRHKQRRKRDSFVHLVQRMEKRSLEAAIRQNLQVTSGKTEPLHVRYLSRSAATV